MLIITHAQVYLPTLMVEKQLNIELTTHRRSILWLFNDAVSTSDAILRRGAYLKVSSWYLSGNTAESHGKPQNNW